MQLLKNALPKISLAIVLLALGQLANAQLFVEGEHLKVEKNALLFIEGDFETEKYNSVIPKIRNLGTIAVKGDVSFDTDTEYKGQGEICFVGTAQQSITPNVALKKLDIQNGNNVVLAGNLNLQSQITLTNGHLDLGNFNLLLDDSASLSGGSSASYVRISGSGRLTAEVGSSPFTFPIGRNPYEPIIIADGGNTEFSVGVTEGVYDDPENTSMGLIGANVVGETWTIQANQSVTDVEVTLQWNENEEEATFNRSSCEIAYWEHGVASAWNSGGPSAAASGSDPYTRSRTIDFTTNLFYLGIGSSGSALPVELTYFTVQWNSLALPYSYTNNNMVELNWQTATEDNNSHFEIERSFDGKNWEQIGRVEGNGTSLSTHNYQFVDNGLESKIQSLRLDGHGTWDMGPEPIYYRLKQVDYNGNFEFSEVRSLNLEPDSLNIFSVYPNPASAGQINFNKLGSYSLYSVTGRLLAQVIDQQQIDISGLANGVYIIKNNEGVSVQFIKE